MFSVGLFSHFFHIFVFPTLVLRPVLRFREGPQVGFTFLEKLNGPLLNRFERDPPKKGHRKILSEESLVLLLICSNCQIPFLCVHLAFPSHRFSLSCQALLLN